MDSDSSFFDWTVFDFENFDTCWANVSIAAISCNSMTCQYESTGERAVETPPNES